MAFICSVRDILGEGVSRGFLSCFVDIIHHILFKDAESILQGKNLSLKQVLMKFFVPSRTLSRQDLVCSKIAISSSS